LRSLTRASFNLAPQKPTVTVAAAYAKNRREAVQPLPPSLVPTLAAHLAGKLPAAPAFAMPKPNMIARILRHDLTKARDSWIKEAKTAEDRAEREKSSFLAYRDDSGKVADFHAFRHTYISYLIAGGVHPKTAQQLARHSTIGLTMDRYAHVFRGDLATALNVLPSLPLSLPLEARATGTENAFPIQDAGLTPYRGQNPVSPGVSLGTCSPAGDVLFSASNRRRDGRVAEGDGLLNRYTGSNPYPGFESPSLRFIIPALSSA
jgi:hypothetical protein